MAYRQRMGYVPEEPHLYTLFDGPSIPGDGRAAAEYGPHILQICASTVCCAFSEYTGTAT